MEVQQAQGGGAPPPEASKGRIKRRRRHRLTPEDLARVAAAVEQANPAVLVEEEVGVPAWQDESAPQDVPAAAAEYQSDGMESDNDSPGSCRKYTMGRGKGGCRRKEQPRELLPLLPGEEQVAAEIMLQLPASLLGSVEAGDEANAADEQHEGQQQHQQQLPGCAAGYKKCQQEFAERARQTAEAVFRAVVEGSKDVPQLPSSLAVALPPGRHGYRRTLCYAVKLRRESAAGGKIDKACQRYGLHAFQLCIQYEQTVQGAAPVPSSATKSKQHTPGSQVPRNTQVHACLLLYLRLMHELFRELVHSPLELPSTVLELQDDSELAAAVRRMRDQCTVFIVYHPPQAWQEARRLGEALGSSSEAVPLPWQPQAVRLLDQLPQQADAAPAEAEEGGRLRKRRRLIERYEASVDEEGRPVVNVVNEAGRVLRRGGTAWDLMLVHVRDLIWRQLTHRPNLQYGDVSMERDLRDIHLSKCQLSCDMMTGRVIDGVVTKKKLGANSNLREALDCARQAEGDLASLYLTDASIPYLPEGRLDSDPGVCCAIDDVVSTGLPHSISTQRGTNVHNFIKNESTGVASATGYLMLGEGGYYNTALHQETLLLPSINLGSGDLVVQLLTSLNKVRKAHRLYGAVVGQFERHKSLLPLHMHLLSGIPLVLHLRDEGFATLVEFPRGSCHGVVTCGSQTTYPTVTKVAFNDMDLRNHVPPAFYADWLAEAYTGHVPPEGHPADNANRWVHSAHLPAQPCTLQQLRQMKRNGSFPPWREEWDGSPGLASDGEEEAGGNGGGGGGGGGQQAAPPPASRPTTPCPRDAELRHGQQEEEEQSSRPLRRSARLQGSSKAAAPAPSSATKRRGHGVGDCPGRQQGQGQGQAQVDVEPASMSLLVVRLAEKLIDVAKRRIQLGRPWSRGVPRILHALQGLADLLPLLLCMCKRAVDELAGEEPASFLQRLPRGSPPVSKQYLAHLIKRVEALGPHGLQEQLESGQFAGAPLEGLPAHHGTGWKQCSSQFVELAVSSSWVLDGYLRANRSVRKMVRQSALCTSEARLLQLGPDVIRGHWLLACHLECELLCRTNIKWGAVASMRHRRSALEALGGRESKRLAAMVVAQMRGDALGHQ